MSAAGLRRRELLGFAALARCASAFGAAPLAGPVEPREPAPAFALTDSLGRSTTLSALLLGQPSVVQLMFTTCSSVCPVQGLLFAQLATRARANAVRWLSISIDALGDDATRLAAWQARFGAHPSWLAAVPAPRDVERLSTWLRGRAARPGTHNTQVFGFDAAARLAQRSADEPAAAEVERLVERIAA